jgi:hypothetical protein
MKSAFYQFGRLLQLVGMADLLYDIITAGAMGPDPKVFAIGIIVFLAGWGLTRTVKPT